MTRNFEQLVEDTRFWLRSSTRPKLSRKNFANQFGVLRSNFEILDSPNQCISGYELCSVISDRCIAGAVRVESIGQTVVASITEFAWYEDNMGLRSTLTGNVEIHVLSDLPGVVLDRVYDQISVPLSRVIQNTGR